ncbi:hypothetical protein LF41_1787 [Lysobacter dokdonensis DS-58]|uniref:Uncharacterized protein n=2 Tax=Noviluteimonas TaxID=3382693 RepID=A0A0A2WDX5_9GAMM|nr:hypothetical protein LF41_1787 [Lysobacter dokdonensis DS-58]
MRFNGPDGPVKGHQLKVVKQVSYQPGENSAGLGARMGETFWYCVGPGQSYWLAMPMRMSRKGLIEWVVRPLTEERMRAALLGDRRALAALDAETTG